MEGLVGQTVCVWGVLPRQRQRPGRRPRGTRAYDTFEEFQSTAQKSCCLWVLYVGRDGMGGVPRSVLGEVGATEGFKWRREFCHQVGWEGHSSDRTWRPDVGWRP